MVEMRQTVTSKDIEGFFQAYPSRCRNRGPLEEHLRDVRYSVNRFVKYLLQQGLFLPSTQPATYQPLLDAYLEWMQRLQHAAPGTLKVRADSLTVFLQWLGQDATPDRLARLSCERIEQFFLAYAHSMGRSASEQKLLPINSGGSVEMVCREVNRPVRATKSNNTIVEPSS